MLCRLLVWLWLLAPGLAHPLDDAALEMKLVGPGAVCSLMVPYPLVSRFDDDRNGVLSPAEVERHQGPLVELVRGGMRFEPAPSEWRLEATDLEVPLATHARVMLHLRWAEAPQGLSLRYELWPPGGDGPRCLLVVDTGASSISAVLTEEDPAFELEGSWQSRASSFFMLGTEHIFTGYDHILFLICLVLPGGTLMSLVKTVTAFTVAHSVTLSLSVLGYITLPSRLVESVIAFSIIVAALLNLRKHDSRRRWPLALGFGLIHGLGFASILQEKGVQGSSATLPLLSFNLGVEAGQLVIVLLCFPILLWMQRQPWARRAVVVLSLITAALATFWLVERLFS